MKYAIKGSYFFHGKENPYTGLFEIEDNNIVGSISDPNSSCRRHEVKGKVFHLKDKIILDFVKIPVGTLKADIFYKLEKANGNGIEGKYKGCWSFGNQEFCQLGLGYKSGVGEVVTINPVGEPEKENKAYLTLDKLV